VFLSHELMRFNVLIETITDSLHTLLRALQGEIPLSDEIECVYCALHTHSVPLLWSGVGYPSVMTLPSWTENLLSRISFLSLWALQGEWHATQHSTAQQSRVELRRELYLT
jgi:dynein heavy chain, axonemal